MSKKKVHKQRKQLPNTYPYWALISVLFAVAFFVFFIGMDSPTGGVTVQPVALMKAGNSLHMGVNVPGVVSAESLLKEDVRGAVIRFEEDETIAFNDVFFSKFSARYNEDDFASKFSDWKFTLRINKNELIDLSINSQDLALFNNGKKLVTTVTKTEFGYVFFEATSPGLGDFVIGRVSQQPVDAEQDIPAKEIPPAEPVVQEPQPVKEIEQPVEEESGFFNSISNFFQNFF